MSRRTGRRAFTCGLVSAPRSRCVFACGRYRDLLRRRLQHLHEEDPEVLHVKGSLATALERRGDLISPPRALCWDPEALGAGRLAVLQVCHVFSDLR